MSIDWDDAVLAPLHGVFDNITVAYTAAGGASFQLTGIFDRGYHQVVILEDGSEAITSSQPVLGVRVSQMPTAPAQSDRYEILSASEAGLQPFVGKTFIVREVRSDSHGEAKLMSNLVAGA